VDALDSSAEMIEQAKARVPDNVTCLLGNVNEALVVVGVVVPGQKTHRPTMQGWGAPHLADTGLPHSRRRPRWPA
jgi:hypothetical protein